jgi:hypothetical protein
MICKQTQNTIDTLLRLKDSPAINKITSLMKKPNIPDKEVQKLIDDGYELKSYQHDIPN